MKIAIGQRYLAQSKFPVRYSRRAPRHTQEFTTGLPANEVANVDRNLSDGIKKYSTKHWAPRHEIPATREDVTPANLVNLAS